MNSLLKAIENPLSKTPMTDEQCLAQAISKGACMVITEDEIRILIHIESDTVRAHIPMNQIRSEFNALPKPGSYNLETAALDIHDIREINTEQLKGFAIEDGGVCVICANYQRAA